MNNNTSSIIDKINGVTRTTSFIYDKDNRPTETNINGGGKITQHYDSVGRLHDKQVDTGTSSFSTSYSYESGVDGSSSTRLASITNGGVTTSYTYYANGNIDTINGDEIKYYYDELNELIREDNKALNKTITYSYDAGGNITAKTEYPYTIDEPGAASAAYSYTYGDSNWKDKLTNYNGQDITYDAIGNPLTYNGWTYTWEKGRQLKSMSGNGHNISYKYNDSGIRTQKTVDGITTNYRLVEDKVTYEDNGTDRIYYSYDASGNIVSMNLNGVEYYYIRNAQGDITGLFDGTGSPVVSYVYDSWGKLISIDGSLKDSVGVKNPYKYRGYRYDSETELYYLNSRYYNPELGRFINTDAIAATPGEILSANMFVYCENNPSTLKDPDGFRPIYAVDPSEETDEERGESFATMNAVSKKEPPPTGVGYVPPKKGKVEPTKAPNGQKGWPDADGNVWVPIPEGHPLAHGGEHWDVNYPNGGYDNVYPPDGHVRKGSGGRGKFSPPGKRIVSDTAAVGGTALLLYGTYRVVRMTPSLAPPLWWTIPANLVCP